MQKVMRQIFILLIVSIIYSGCENPSAPYKEKVAGLTIKGNIFEYKKEYRNISYAIGYSYNLVDSAVINNYGKFDLFVKNPDPSSLWSYYKAEGLRGRIMDYDSVYFSNPSVKYTFFEFTIRMADGSRAPIDKKKAEVGALPEIGDYYVKYYYSSDTTSVSGKHEVKFLDNGYKEITNYNIKFEKGWNQLSYELIQKNDSTEVYEVTNADTTLNNWVLFASNFFSSWRL